MKALDFSQTNSAGFGFKITPTRYALRYVMVLLR